MNRIKILLIFLVIPFILKAQEKMDLFIWAGQSNAQGWMGDGSHYPQDKDKLDESIRLNWTFVDNTGSGGRWITMQAQQGRFPKGHFGPEVSFSRKLKKAGYNPAIFKYTKGATGLYNNWKGPGQDGIYDRMVTDLKKAIHLLEEQGHKVIIRGFIWIQGESDAGNEVGAENYYPNLKRLIGDLRRNVVDNHQLKVILGVDEQHKFVKARPIVVESQKKIADEDDNIVFTSMYGLQKADGTHLTPAGLVKHGERIFEAYKEMTSNSSLGGKSGGMLKVMTYNIWNGFDWGKDIDRRAKLVKWINKQKTDIVALQELCGYTPQKLQEDAKGWGHNYSALLKTSGYPVGLTSKYPIEIKEKIIDGMHHGALHCKTAGIDVFVIHFWPGNFKFREEIAIISERLKKVRETNSNYIVLGDFNAYSPMDADLYDTNGYLFTRKKDYNKDEMYLIDFEAISSLLAFPLVDVCQPYTKGIAERGTFPGRVLCPINNETTDQLVSRLERIDYILVSPELAKKCKDAKVCNGKENWFLSDHYPVVAEFDINE